jgi:hypothetical protein
VQYHLFSPVFMISHPGENGTFLSLLFIRQVLENFQYPGIEPLGCVVIGKSAPQGDRAGSDPLWGEQGG